MGLELLDPSWLALWILGSWQGINFMGKGLGGGKLLIPWQPGSKEADRKDHTETPKDTPLITSPLTTSPQLLTLPQLLNNAVKIIMNPPMDRSTGVSEPS